MCVSNGLLSHGGLVYGLSVGIVMSLFSISIRIIPWKETRKQMLLKCLPDNARKICTLESDLKKKLLSVSLNKVILLF